VLARLANKTLQLLFDLASHLAQMLPALVLLVGNDSSFLTVLSASGEGCVPPRDQAIVFGPAHKLLVLAQELADILGALFQGAIVQGAGCSARHELCAMHVELNLERVLPRVLQLLGRIARECMAPLANNATRSIAQL